MLTVREAIGLALPPETRVVAGSSGLGREVGWARMVRAQPTSLEAAEEGDLALLLFGPPATDNGAPSPHTVVRELAQQGVAAIVAADEAPAEACAAADQLGLPLLALPTSANPREVEKSVIRLVLNRRAELEQRGVQIYRQLAQCVTTGRGLSAILTTLSQITGKSVALQEHSMALRLYHCPPGARPTAEELPAVMAASGWSGEWPQGHPYVSTAPPIARFLLLEQGLARFSSQIIVYDYVVGYISVVAPEEEMTDIDRVAVGRAASVCAIEMTKEHAVVEAENRTRGELVDSLMANDGTSDEALAERAFKLGFDLPGPLLAAVFAFDRLGPNGATSAGERGIVAVLREEITAHEPHALLKVREGSVVAFIPLVAPEGDYTGLDDRHPSIHGPSRSEPVRRRLEAVRQRASHRLQIPLSVGVGRLGRGAGGARKSFREAEQALSIAQRLLGGDRATAFDELRVFRLLLPLVGTGELRAFFSEVLGRLLEYDAKHSGELIHTLEAFFAYDGNLQRAADALFLHRNTLAYRLERIEEIAGVSLHDPDDRLCLQLALKIRLLD